MKREVNKLSESEFDLLVIGGGIFGACSAWEACLRGLKVALIEAEDFCSGVSANSYKIVHGGIRYIQHLDIPRVRASARERSALIRVAPHLVKPLPVLVPTYGYGMLGKPILGAGMLLYDFFTLDRNKEISDPERKIPFTQFLSREEVLKEYPDIDSNGLTGACVFNDGRLYNPTRLVWEFVHSAIDRGLIACNYIEAEDLILEDNRVKGVIARDTLTQSRVTIKAKMVLNASGPWTEKWLQKNTKQPSSNIKPYKIEGTYSRDACFVVNRKLETPYTLAVQGQTHDPDALISRPARHLFLSPWRDYTLVGVWHIVTDRNPSTVSVDKEEIESYIKEVNASYPKLNLSMDDVINWNAGLVPFGENEEGNENLSYGKRSHLLDHAQLNGVEGLVSLIGVRYTMGRGEAEKAIDLVQRKFSKPVTRPNSDFVKLRNAHFANFQELVNKIKSKFPEIEHKTAVSLAHNHGSNFATVLKAAESQKDLIETFTHTATTKAEIIYVCQNEMVERLADVVFRRTDFATAGNPGEQQLTSCAELVAKELNWDNERTNQELVAVRKRFAEYTNPIYKD